MCYTVILTDHSKCNIITVTGLLATGAYTDGLSWEDGTLNNTTRRVTHRRTVWSRNADILPGFKV